MKTKKLTLQVDEIRKNIRTQNKKEIEFFLNDIHDNEDFKDSAIESMEKLLFSILNDESLNGYADFISENNIKYVNSNKAHLVEIFRSCPLFCLPPNVYHSIVDDEEKFEFTIKDKNIVEAKISSDDLIFD